MSDNNRPAPPTPEWEAGYLTGATWGIDYGRRQAEQEQADMEQRDEQLARRIVAQLLQHDYNGELVRSVVALHPYPGRTPTGINWRERLGDTA